jgi:acyl carrier protein
LLHSFVHTAVSATYCVKGDNVNAIERMCDIWQTVFEVENVPADADFFQLGGDSLKATVLMLYVEESFGLIVDPVEVFETPALSEFTDKIIQIRNLEPGPAPQEQIL